MKLTNHQKTIIASQAAGMIGTSVFSSGVLLSYSQFLSFSSSVILILLALPELMGFLIILPAAYFTKRASIKLLGAVGILLGIIGFVILLFATYTDNNRIFIAFAGVGLIGFGWAMFNSGWYALIGPLIDKNIRGRFLGILRFSWQLTSIIFSFLALSILKYIDDLPIAYNIILISVIALQILRLYLYKKIPDQTESELDSVTFVSGILNIIKNPSFMSYCCYVFFLILFTASSPWLINLAEKDFLNFTQPQIIFVNTFFYGGNLLGFFIAGVIIDRHGTKLVFIISHFAFGLILLLFVARDLLIMPYIYSHCILMFFYGIVFAASSIAITTELYDVIPFKKTLIAGSFFALVLSLSRFLGALVSSQILHLNLLTKTWTIGSFSFNCYDTILIGNAGMVILLVMTLGLIPSVQKNYDLNNPK